MIAALRILAALVREEKSLSDLGHAFEAVPQKLVNIDTSGSVPLDSGKVQKAIRNGEKQLGEKGRLVIRASGTEPVVRIMAQGDDEKLICEVINNVSVAIEGGALMSTKNGRVLVVAGSDSSGGAGIQADIKTITALGGYAATAVTALTAQNTTGVKSIQAVEPAFIAHQMKVVLEDIGADVLKTGMLHSAPVIDVVAGVYRTMSASMIYVLDPVMVAKGGHRLLDSNALEALKQRLLPLADLVTPNIPEAEALTGIKIKRREHMEIAANKILSLGPGSVLLKGGHLKGNRLYDLLVTSLGSEWFETNLLILGILMVQVVLWHLL